jgi:RNA polymerase sigma-70 factor (ECF subfamily)
MQTDMNNREAGELIPTRSTLLSRLKDLGDDQSWRRFFDTYWKLIYGVALKSGLREIEAQEVVQETVIAVSRNIGGFKYDRSACSFKTWLMTVTRSRISNQFRRRRRHAPVIENSDSDTGTNWLERLPDERGDSLALMWDQEWERNLMDAAIERVKRRAPAEQIQILGWAERRWG